MKQKAKAAVSVPRVTVRQLRRFRAVVRRGLAPSTERAIAEALKEGLWVLEHRRSDADDRSEYRAALKAGLIYEHDW